MSFAVGPESVVLSGTTAASLAYPNITSGSLVVRSRHPDGTDTSWPHLNVIASNVTYVEGWTITVDYTAGDHRSDGRFEHPQLCQRWRSAQRSERRVDRVGYVHGSRYRLRGRCDDGRASIHCACRCGPVAQDPRARRLHLHRCRGRALRDRPEP